MEFGLHFGRSNLNFSQRRRIYKSCLLLKSQQSKDAFVPNSNISYGHSISNKGLKIDYFPSLT